ncbi:MAG TPA: hypothetical protein VKP30_15085 [Polyangiaceae bacterium]|nr:hypothetical protein [Polyangiaceae bacterium]
MADAAARRRLELTKKKEEANRLMLEQRKAKTEAAAKRKNDLLKAIATKASFAEKHGQMSATEANRFPLETVIANDKGFKLAAVALVGLGAGDGVKLPPQVKEVLAALDGVALSLTMIELNPVTAKTVSNLLSTLVLDLKIEVLCEDIVKLAKSKAYAKAYDRMISTMTLMYPLKDLSEEAARLFVQDLVGLLRPNGRLYVDSKHTRGLIKDFAFTVCAAPCESLCYLDVNASE